MKKKIIIAGGSGYLGKCLSEAFSLQDYEIVILSRQPGKSDRNVRFVNWDAEKLGSWGSELEGSGVVINLTGKSVNCRYNEKNKAEIINSRVNSTRVIGEAIQRCTQPPQVWINAGSAAIFGNAGEEIKTESSQVGTGFSPDVCKRWEKAFTEMDTPQTRKVFLRIGMVLQIGAGVLKPFMNIVKTGFGGKIGSGKQYLTWIHEKDFVAMIKWIIENKEIAGIIHCASPNPVRNKEFMKELRTACNVSLGIPTPGFFVRLGSIFIGTEPELALSGRKVVSEILPKYDFKFEFPELKDALKDLITNRL